MKRFVFTVLFLLVIFSQMTIAGEISLEVTDCKDSSVIIKPDSKKIVTCVGDAVVSYTWENIQEISFDCNAVPVEKKIEGTVLKLIPAKFTFKNGTSNDRLIRYFHKSGDDYNFALTGEVQSGGSYLILTTEIKTIKVLSVTQ